MFTKQAIKRLQNSELEVRLWNGCFNVVKATAKFSKGRAYELSVEVTHPSLSWQCGDKNLVSLVHWQGYSGVGVEIPEELNPLIERMKQAGTMSDELANKISSQNRAAFLEDMREFGFSL